MSTYRQLVYMVLDELKIKSDDSHFQEEHIIFLLDKYRAFILKQRYSDIRKEIPESNYQTICVDLNRVSAINGEACTGLDYMKSIQEIPHFIPVGEQKVSSVDFFQGNFIYTNNERFKYVGENKYLKRQIYSTIAPDSHLYLKGNNPQLYYLERVKITGIFEDSAKAAKLQCDDTVCDVMDMVFPLEEALIPPVIDMIIKDLSNHLYQPSDEENNANDDLGKLANYIARNLKERRE